jgi:hypothetical protein
MFEVCPWQHADDRSFLRCVIENTGFSSNIAGVERQLPLRATMQLFLILVVVGSG